MNILLRLYRTLIFTFILGITNLTSSPVWSQTNLSFSKKDYHASNQNWSVDFDHEGVVYFGNSTGLLEYDGVSWLTHPSPNASIIRAVAVDKQTKKIYTGGYRELGYWERSTDGQLKYISLTHLVSSHFDTNEEFWNILVTNNTIVFQSFSGLYIYNNNDFTVIKNGFINYSTKIHDDIFVNITNQGILKLEQNELIPFIENDFLIEKRIRFIANTNSENTYYIGTESDGLYSYNTQTKTVHSILTHLTSFFEKNKINHGIINSHGHLVIGTILDGALILTSQGQVLHHYNKANGLKSNTVLDIGLDRLNNIWLALDSGIEFIPNTLNNHKTVYTDEQLGAVYCATLFNHHLYVGTNQGLYMKPWNTPNSKFKLVNHTQGQIWDCQCIDNKLFVSHNSGALMISDNLTKDLYQNTGTYMFTQHPSNPCIMFQGSYNDLLVYRKKNGQWQFSNHVKGFGNLIRHIEMDHLGNLWASHVYQGLYKLRLNEKLDSVISVKHYDQIDAENLNLKNLKVFKVEGRIAITTGKQIYTYDDLNDTIIAYHDLNHKLGEYKKAHRIIAASDHRYWFITKAGLACYKFNPDSVHQIKAYPNSIFQDNLIPTHENVAQINDSNLVVCMENGYSLLNLSGQESSNDIASQQLILKEIRSFDKNNKEQHLDITNGKVTIPFGNNNLKLRYSFPLINGDALSYHYLIDGLSEEWSKPLDKPVFELTRIPPGNYTLHVKATNNWHKTSKTHYLQITVKSPWYLSWPAITLYFTVLICVFIWSKQLTTRKVKLKEKRKREDKEKELIQVKNEKLEAELSHKSQQLASSTMGIITKNEFLLSLKEKINRQKEALGTRYPDKYYTDLIGKIDENISGQNDWQVFEANFEQAHKTFLKTLKQQFPDLTPGDLRLCAYLRINLTSKEIAPLLGISVRGVENHRYRLRKKMHLSAETNLTDFILNF